MRNSRQFILACAAVISASIGLFHVFKSQPLTWEFAVQAPSAPSNSVAKFQTIFDYKSPAGTAHSAAIRKRDDGFSIIWFDGTAESNPDVVIKQAKFLKYGDDWKHEEPVVFLTPKALSQVTTPRQPVWVLGNIVQNGNLHDSVLATIVSIGGWSMSSIASVDLENDVPVSARKLSLSPFLNRSQLVRAPTISYSDGSVAIPAYFEIGNAFGELVRLDRLGRVRDKIRISQGSLGIQPMIVPIDSQNAVALMRNFEEKSDRLVATWTKNGGKNWTSAKMLELPNPSAPVAALLLNSTELLMAFNNSATDAKTISLAISSDMGRSWRVVRTIGPDGGDMRYPAMERLPDGDILLTYSYGRKTSIKGLVFNEAWVLGQ